jgi:hypothetical protein
MFVESPAKPTAPESGDELPLAELERRIAGLAADINAATCRWLSLVAEFDERAGHERHGFVSCASWLAWRCSLTARAAREQLRVARTLRELPGIQAAFGSGSLSYSKVRALTRVAEPAMEAELLELAEEATAAQLERIVRGYRRATAGDDELAREKRHLSTRWEDDGTLTVRGNLPAEEGELLLKALDLAQRELAAEDLADAEADGRPSEGDAPPPPRRTKADAIVAMAEATIRRGVSPAAGGDRHQVVLHVDVDGGSGDRGARAAFEHGVTATADAAARLACDASIVTLVEKAGEPLSVGRKTRSVPPALQRALRDRDGGCRFPGCGRDRWVDAHHIQHWAQGGQTSLDNLVQLCRHHHRLVHEGGFSVERQGERLEFREPGGRLIPDHPPRAAGRPRQLSVSGQDPFPRSAGSPFDLDLTVWGLAHRRDTR